MFEYFLTHTPRCTIFLGTGLVVLFIAISLIKGTYNKLILGNAANIFLNVALLISGVKLFFLAVEGEIPSLSEENCIYMGLGGVVLMWVASAEIIKHIK